MKTKFNIVDVIIILVIVAVIAVAGFFLLKSPAKQTTEVSNANTEKIQFVVEVKNVTETTSKSFKAAEGENVSFGETATGAGTITNVDIVPFTKWVKNTEEGTVVISEVPDRYTVNVTIEADVQKTETSFTSGSESINVGRAMCFNSKGVAAEECYIIKITEIE